MISVRRRAVPALLAGLTLTLACAGCSHSADSTQAPHPARSAHSPDAADRTFLQDMIPHHERAIQVARIGIEDATDPRVEAFARRIVREQSPELATMQARAKADHFRLDEAVGAQMAVHRISNAEVSALRRLRGHAFDEQFLRLNVSSEQGAAQMARLEVSSGHDPIALRTARGIASAPDTEIPELQKLLHELE